MLLLPRVSLRLLLPRSRAAEVHVRNQSAKVKTQELRAAENGKEMAPISNRHNYGGPDSVSSIRIGLTQRSFKLRHTTCTVACARSSMDPLLISAASGMKARMESLDMLANNIANTGTIGFKTDKEFYGLYQQQLPVIQKQWTDFS